MTSDFSCSAALSRLALAFCATVAIPPASAQALPGGVALGMSTSELRQAIPDLEKVPRPQRMAGGLVGSWHTPNVEVLGLSGEWHFYMAHDHLARAEFSGAAPDDAVTGQAFDRLVAWGRGRYGPEVAAEDPGSRYAQWTAGDVQVYVQYAGPRGGVRLVYKPRIEPDASRL